MVLLQQSPSKSSKINHVNPSDPLLPPTFDSLNRKGGQNKIHERIQSNDYHMLADSSLLEL